MMIKFSWGFIAIPLIILFNVAMFAVEVVMLRAGTGSLNSGKPQAWSSGWQAIIIDAGGYQFEVGKPQGLPDSPDPLQPKVFFALYPSLYCSGQKKEQKTRDRYGNPDYSYEADYCSPWGKLFNLQGLWREWGVDLVTNNYIGQNPRTIWTSLLVTACMTALSTTLKVLGFCFFYAKVASCTLSWVSFVCLVTMSWTSQTFVGNLVSALPKLDTPGTGQILGQSGPILGRVSWVLTAISLGSVLIETLLLYLAYRRRRQSANKSKASAPLSYNGGGYGKDSSAYQEVGGGSPYHPSSGSDSRFGSTIELVSGRPVSRISGGATQQQAYEPMRHHHVG